jgi:HAD superfamily hydrolase (TIGR01484 family)
MMFFAYENYSSEHIDKALKQLSAFDNLTVYKSHHKKPGKYGLNITHINATKLHGIEMVLKKLGLKHDEVIGVGDSYNDFPLLMSCGLKIAMGNAVSDLKEIADYVAPSVQEDGVSDVIEKFVLT